MKLPYSMILDLVQTKLTAQEVGDLLTMAGFELEGLDEVEGDSVLDIKVVANRGDGLSALGLAREILAKDPESKGTELYQRAADHFPSSDSAIQGKATVRIECDTCTRFACRIIRGVKNGPSPDWLQKKLRQAGQRTISLLVDLTNFVMLELGQPLHAYDLEKLGGASIVVRNAREGEKLTTLNGEEHRLQTHHMVICNENEPVGVAGVMGGLDTEVSETTQDILLEAAHFTNSSVRKTRKDLGFNTEASYRFERSVDPCGVVGALNRFCELYVQCGGTGVENGVTDQVKTKSSQTEVSLRLSRAVKLLGMPITHGEALQYLSRLGFEVKSDGENVKVKSPSWRPDILREEDLVEEIGRIHGYERIPETPIYGSNSKGGVFGIPRLADRAREALLRCGFHQAINHTLRDRHLLDFSKDWRMGPRNPHSPEMAYMRDSLLPGLAEVAQRNGGKNIQVFEIGKVFLQGEYQIDESPEIAILCTGERSQPSWAGNPPAQADFFSLKGVVEELAAALGDSIVFDYPRDPDRRFHPTRQAGVLLDSGRLWAGTVGQIHPDYAEELGLPNETFMAELDLLVFAIQDDIEHPLVQVSKNPSIRRDIAVVVPKTVSYQSIEKAINEACGEILERQWLFDVYEGKGINPGDHSLAIAMQFRKPGANLTDEDANGFRNQAIEALKALGGQLR